MRLIRSLLPLLSLWSVAWGSLSVKAQTRSVALVPPSSEIEFRTYGLGVLPIDSHFTAFQGTLSYDPSDRARCEASLTATVASLVASKASIRDIIVGSDSLDVAKFPTLHFAGRCDASGLTGMLTMRRMTRPLRLTVAWDPHRLTVQGVLRHADWGITAKPFLVGGTVRIRVTTAVP
jgi:polyisoprenoid-binding protein YceI